VPWALARPLGIDICGIEISPRLLFIEQFLGGHDPSDAADFMQLIYR
jgi:hypothetical protein